jgi:4'-phosphopantetheinyl transferase
MQAFLWLNQTDRSPERLASAYVVLEDHERVRADGFRFDSDRERFVIARAFLRTALAEHLGIGPAEVRFEEARATKPRLAGPAAASGLEFSFSRSDDLALCGISLGRRIGVDIERTRSMPDLDDVASTVMSSAELAHWRAVPEQNHLEAFYRIWTRKEALGKATGQGIGIGPRMLVVPPDLPTGRAVSVRAPDRDERWLLADLGAGRGVAACTAIEPHARDGASVRYDDTVVGPGERSSHRPWSVPPGAQLTIRRFER